MIELIPIDKLRADPTNVRRDVGDVTDLAASIRSVGLLNKLVVTRADDGCFDVVAGHRRLEACRLAGLAELECDVRDDLDDAGRVEAQLVENLRRADLAALEEAAGYRRLVELGLSQRDIADKVGCTQPHVSKRLSLLDLPERAADALDAGDITIEQAVALAKYAEHPDLIDAWVADDSWNRRNGSIADWMTTALRRRARAEAVAELVAKLTAKGRRVLTERPSWSSGARELGRWELDIDAKTHAAEPCHAIYVWAEDHGSSTKAKQKPFCLDPKRHTPNGVSTLKAKRDTSTSTRGSSPLDRAKAKAARTAAARRRAFVADKLAGAGLPRERLLAVALESYVARATQRDAKRACAILGIETPAKSQWGGDDWTATFRGWAAASDTNLVKAAAAFVHVEAEDRYTSTYAPTVDLVARYEQLLTAAGYDPEGVQ